MAIDRITVTLIALTAGVWAMVLFVAWAVVSLPTTAVEASDVHQCDPRRPDEEQCPDDQWCVHGECTPHEEPQVAQRGEQCRDCPCDVGLRCGADLRCRPSNEPEAPAPTCGDPAVEAAVSQLTQACLKRRTSVQDRVEGGEGCSADEWRALLADDDQMNALLGAFPDRLAVYFPTNEPLARQPWPAQAARPYIVGELARHAKALREAKILFVIGRSSPDGKPADDHALALRRINAVERLIDQALGRDKPSERGQGPMLIGWGAPSDRPVALKQFVDNYAGTQTPIAVSRAESERLAAGFAAVRAGQEPKESRTLQRDVNRVVLVIPVPCAGTKETR
ncbi:hypothetical protein OV090_00330 [Nannocystis sp. RBIL2]|uniref:hypothetical protein n=1 Tax=Nannocystis sp. RBIL2 TaxID=2996788 RepID=UPI00226F3E8F|nr:hypothetical protein [Nannocystis sp. RBIL2]MCY1063187.1 hypothetical protein [Nannocystis sp. RBIL2]